MKIRNKGTGEIKEVVYAAPWNDFYTGKPPHGYSDFTVLNSLGERYLVQGWSAEIIEEGV